MYQCAAKRWDRLAWEVLRSLSRSDASVYTSKIHRDTVDMQMPFSEERKKEYFNVCDATSAYTTHFKSISLRKNEKNSWYLHTLTAKDSQVKFVVHKTFLEHHSKMMLQHF